MNIPYHPEYEAEYLTCESYYGSVSNNDSDDITSVRTIDDDTHIETDNYECCCIIS